MSSDLEGKAPELAALFAAADEDLAADDFTESVSAKVTARPTQALWFKLVLVGAVVLFGWLLSTPVAWLSVSFIEGLATPLFALEDDVMATALGPVNSVAAVLGFVFLIAQKFWRKLHSS